MRELTSHKVNGLNEALNVAVLDEPGQGGACHRYVIYAPNDTVNQELNASMSVEINFQNGPIKEAGVNGISNEALLAVVIDRMQGFQSGDFACSENEEALQYCRKALEALQRRTLKRVARGVEGTNQK